MHFWASWCGPCKQQFPALRQLQERLAARGLATLGLSLDEDSAGWHAALMGLDLPWQQGRLAAAGDAGVSGVPAYWLLDPAGKIVAKVNDPDELAAAADKAEAKPAEKEATKGAQAPESRQTPAATESAGTTQTESKKSPAPSAPAELEQPMRKSGVYMSTYTSADIPADYIIVPVYAYVELANAEMRKELNFSSEQTKRLREISDNHYGRAQKLRDEMLKQMETLSPEDRTRQQAEFQAKSNDEERATRKKIEELLTVEQLAALRTMAVGRNLGRLLMSSKLAKKIGISPEQQARLAELSETQSKQDAGQRSGESYLENEKKAVAVLTSEQWEQLEQIIAGERGRAVLSFSLSGGYPIIEVSELDRPDIGKELGLTPEQKAKVEAIVARSQSQAVELSKLVGGVNSLLPAKEQQTKSDEFGHKMADTVSRDRREIAEVLTPEQLASLKKLIVRRIFLLNLDLGRLTADGPATPQQTLLDRINLTKEQREELRRLHSENEQVRHRLVRELGERAIKVLSPEQQERFMDGLNFSIASEPPDESAP